MSTLELSCRSGSDTRSLDRLTREQRSILDAIEGQSLPTTEQHLAAVLTATTWQDRSTRAARTRLHHVDLPKLAEAGYLTWDDSEAVVTGVDAPSRASDRPTNAAAGLEGELSVVSNLVERLHGPQHETDLAYVLAAITGSSDPDSEIVEEMAIKVRHCYLPKLDEAGLVEYDPDDGMASAIDSLE